jgi:hypothetical protein
MPKLIGTEEWNKELIRHKVSYLLDSITDADELTLAFGPVERALGLVTDRLLDEEIRDVRLEQFTEAAALLLVSDDLPETKRLFGDLGRVLTGQPNRDNEDGFGEVQTNVRQFVRLSLFATLVRQGQLRGTGEELVFRTKAGSLRLSWAGEPEQELFVVLPTLYAIAVASKSEPSTLFYLADLISTAWDRFGGSDLFERPEFQVLGIYELSRGAEGAGIPVPNLLTGFNGFFALREVERNYASRIRQMREDTYHWSRLNPTGDLVDWVLLITEVAALRSDVRPFFPEDLNLSPEIRFCWDLAKAFE